MSAVLRSSLPKTATLTLLLVLLATVALAQESPAAVTEAQVAIYQLGVETGCKHAGRRRGDPPELVDSLCNCVIQTLKDNVTFSEWQQAYYYSSKRLDRQEAQVLALHMPKIKTCKPNAL
jgi:hypothetical protein